MEIWDVYNKDRIKTERTMKRGSAFADGDYHMVVHICIFDRCGKMLIQQRQPFKQGWPNMWDITVGGSATTGDSSASAAERELFEELGYKLDFTNIRPHLTINFDNGFDDYYLVEKDVDIASLTLQHEEVRRVKWATKDEILSMINENIFVPYYKDLISLLFEMRVRYGSQTHE